MTCWRAALIGFGLTILSSSQLACVTTQLAATPHGGTAAVGEAVLVIGDREYRPNRCRSGDLEYFFGVDLLDADGAAAIRVVIDPLDGARLRVAQGRGEARESFLLSREDCRLLQVDVHHTGWHVNDVRDVAGSIDAECRAADGREVSVHVRFSHCH
jgi:hypothetical protein